MSEDLNTKSLGEKLHDAVMENTPLRYRLQWAETDDKTKSHMESIALAFAGSLSHDKTASAVIVDLTERATAAEKRAEKVEVAMLNVQQQCENAAFNLRQKPTGALSNKEAVAIFDRLATTLRIAALKTEGA